MVQGHQVGYSAQRHQVEKLGKARFLSAAGKPACFAQNPAHHGHQVKHHPDSRQGFTGKLITCAIGIHDGMCIRNHFTGKVVVGHDHQTAQLPGPGNPLVAADPRIDRDE